jgi:hypothetical protein
MNDLTSTLPINELMLAKTMSNDEKDNYDHFEINNLLMNNYNSNNYNLINQVKETFQKQIFYRRSIKSYVEYGKK